MTWNMQTRSMTFSGFQLPQIVGVMPTGEELGEPMLTVRSVKGREAIGELFEYVVLAQVENPDFLQTLPMPHRLTLLGSSVLHGAAPAQQSGAATRGIQGSEQPERPENRNLRTR